MSQLTHVWIVLLTQLGQAVATIATVLKSGCGTPLCLEASIGYISDINIHHDQAIMHYIIFL